MPIDINEGCKQRLAERLAAALADVRVNNMSYLDYQSLSGLNSLDAILPERGDVRDKLELYVSETPVFDFLYGEISQELQDSEKFNADFPDIPLSEIGEYENLDATSSNLIEKLDSLPRKYCFTFRLGNEIAKHIEEEFIEISDDIRIIKNGGGLEADFPLKSDNPLRDKYLHGGGLLGLLGPAEWDADSVFIQVFQEGFVGNLVTTEPKHRAIETFKSILGLLISLRGLMVKHSFTSVISKSRAYTHQQNKTWEIKAGFELDDDIGKTLNLLRIDNLNASLDSDKKKASFLRHCLNVLSKALNSSADSEKLMLAGRWVFDSYCGRNELLSFIQITVSLEILLGEKSSSGLMGLSELLRNRCAYLIGKTHQQREEVLEDFKKIYDIRSKIVHRGKGRLQKHERALFYKLQWMANRVIQEEIELMGKNA